MLLHFGVVPYLVFDGGPLPSKEVTEVSRAARRAESKKLGEEHLRRGRRAEAHQELQKAVDVTPQMARVLIEELKKHNVQYVVAPYEADSQLVYLEKQGIINGIISEDSDMLVFGAKRLLSKLDKHGDCIELNRGDFAACRDISLIGWTDENFRHMCILSGCDYLPNIPKIGLKKAYRGIRRHKSVERAVKMIQFEGATQVPPGYLEDFKRAELTFLHQRVFCPAARRLVTLNPIPADKAEQDMPFIGADIEPEIAIGIARGDLDPVTKEQIVIKESYSERARLVRTGRQILPSSTEKKPSREIRDFFTPKRVPLGELDPNSLTPSPSQQQVLIRHQRRSWAPQHVSTPPSVARAASSIPSTPNIQSSEAETFLTRAARISQPQPLKRQRLCSDASEGLVERKTGESSRYFVSNSAGQTSSGQAQTQRKMPKRASFPVFLDRTTNGIGNGKPDSSQDTRASLSNGDLVATEATKETDNSTAGATPKVQLALPPPAFRSETISPPHTAPTQQMAIKAGDESNMDDSTSNQTDTRKLKLHERYAYKSDISASAPPRIFSAGKAGVGQSREFRRQQLRLTPLQRLKQNALSRSKSLNNLGHKKIRGNGREDSGYVSDSKVKISARANSAASYRGSEDMIIPDSEEDEEEEEDEQEGSSDEISTSYTEKDDILRHLNLKRFEHEP